MRKQLGGTPGEQPSGRAVPANTEKPAPAVEREHEHSVNDRPFTDNACKPKAGASAPKRKKRFVL